MQKKFWSALLSMAMIISCFSGVAMASGNGSPSYQMSSPVSSNVDFGDNSSRAVIVFAPNTAINLSGRLMAQGSESKNTEYLTSSKVAELYKKITGSDATKDDDKTLVFGLLNDPMQSDPDLLHNGTVTAPNAVERWYLDRWNSTSEPTKASKDVLVNKFVGSTTNMVNVDSDGRYATAFIGEAHTTRYYGFGIKGLQNPKDPTVYAYETNSTILGSDDYDQAIADAKVELTAAEDKVTAHKAAYVVSTAYEAMGTSYKETAANVTYSDVVAFRTALRAVYEVYQTSIDNGAKILEDLQKEETATNRAYVTAQGAVSISGAAYGKQVSELQDMLLKLAQLENANTELDNAGTVVADVAEATGKVYTAAEAVVRSATDGAYLNNIDQITAAYSVYEANNSTDSNVAVSVYWSTAESFNAAAQSALTAKQNSVSSTKLTYEIDLGDMSAKKTAYLDAAKEVQNELDRQALLIDPYFVAAHAAVKAQLDVLDSVSSTAIARFETALAPLVDEVTRLEALIESLEGRQGNTAGPKASTVANRYLQGAPLEVRIQYKLRDAAMSFVAGTSTPQTISGYIVDANGNAPARDFDYEVYTTSTPGSSATPVATGRTSGGYFIFTVNNIELADYVLFPTQRYTTNTNDPYRDANGMVRITPKNISTRYAYTVASGTRKPFYRAELATNSAVSNVTYQTIMLDKLYTYDEGANYDVRKWGIGSDAPQSYNQAAYLYGVSYVLRIENTDQFIAKNYTINSTTQNVDMDSTAVGSWKLVTGSAGAYVFDATGAALSAPLKVNEQGKLTFNGQVVEVCFTGTGTASLRLRASSREAIVATLREGYQSVVTINVESPGIVAHVGKTEINSIDWANQEPTKIELYSTADSAHMISQVRLDKIRYEGMTDEVFESIAKDKYLKADIKDTTIGYTIGGTANRDITIFVPWNLVTSGGQNLELDLTFLDKDNTVVTSKTVVMKNNLWKVSASSETLGVSSNNNFYATVTNADGIEQNRARLEIRDEVKALLGTNRSYNVVGGQYTFENVNPSTGGTAYILVKESSDEDASVKAMTEIEIVGKADYTATMVAGKESAVTGLSTTLSFNALNASGSAALDLINATVHNLSGKKSTNFVDYDKLKLTHRGNGLYEIPVVGLKPGSYILRVSTSNMGHYIDIPFEVLQLDIEFADDFSAITWDYSYGKNADFRNSNKMSFTVKNPLTGAKVNTAIDGSKFELLTENGDKSDLVPTLANTVSPYPSGRLTLTDKDYSSYLINNTYDTHTFYVGLVDTRNAATRSAEGDLSLVFYLIVKEGNSTGNSNTVEGFTVPIKQPTLTTSTSSVARGTTTSVDLIVKDANENPVVGIQLRTDAEDMAQRTDAEGKTTYLFTPLTLGSSQRFDITGFAMDQYIQYADGSSIANVTIKSAPVFATVRIVSDSTDPTISLNPYVSETTKSSVTISGKLFDEGGLSEIAVGDKGRRYNGQSEAEFSYTISLEYGRNDIVIMAFDSSNNSSEVTVSVMRKDASVMVLTVGSTETVGVSGLDVAPVVRNGVTFLPIRFVFENMLKGKVDYDANSKTITASFMGHTLVLTIGSTTAILDGQNITLSSAPEIDPASNRTLAPIRTILQSVGITVDYNASNGAITITGAGDQDVITYPSNAAAPAPTTTPAPEVEEEEEVVEETEEVVEEEVEEEVTE